KGLNNSSSIKDYYATDYMLGTILFVYCLLFINTFYLSKLDVSRSFNLLNSQNNDTAISLKKELMNIQSAENWKGFSETVCQLPDTEDYKFWNWFAGVLDGDGNLDIRVNPTSKERVLKQIRIKLHKRDIRILKRIQDYLHIGRIRADKKSLILFI
uniref:LAGLIDADG homing endonuclease n=1 Tax=Cyathus pallidus TaxID=380665 RepID=UPI002551D1B6